MIIFYSSPGNAFKFLNLQYSCTYRRTLVIVTSRCKSTSGERDYYDILGVDSKASPSDIKRAFYARSKMLHPDHCARGNSTAEFVQLKTAYDVLRRPADRLIYDNRGKKQPNMYNPYMYNYQRPHYDDSRDWKQYWSDNHGEKMSESDIKRRSEQQWRTVLMWTGVGFVIVILYNLGYLLQIHVRDRRLSKLVDEDEIAKSFLRQAEFKGTNKDSGEVEFLARMLKTDVDEAWRRRNEEMQPRNRNEIREEYRWMRAVQDPDHTRRIKEKRAEERRHPVRLSWGTSEEASAAPEPVQK